MASRYRALAAYSALLAAGASAVAETVDELRDLVEAWLTEAGAFGGVSPLAAAS